MPVNRFSSFVVRYCTFGALLCIASLSNAQSANAQIDATAQELYTQALADLDAGRAAEARPKLEEVTRLAPDGLGAKLTLGECYERLDRFASAWSQYSIVAATAPQKGQSDRARKAKALATAIHPKLATLMLIVSPRIGSIAGILLERDGIPINQAQWNLTLPVDIGIHEIVATAPGYTRWSTKVDIAKNGSANSVTIETPIPLPTPPPEHATSRQPSTPLTPTPLTHSSSTSTPSKQTPSHWVWVSGSIGLAATGASIAFLLDYVSVQQTIIKTCPDNLCNRSIYTEETVQSLNTRWNRDVGLAVGLGTVGLAGMSAAIIGLVSSRSNLNRVGVVPFVAPTISGIMLHGAF